MNVNVQVNVWYSVQGLESQNFRENFNVPSNYGRASSSSNAIFLYIAKEVSAKGARWSSECSDRDIPSVRTVRFRYSAHFVPGYRLAWTTMWVDDDSYADEPMSR